MTFYLTARISQERDAAAHLNDDAEVNPLKLPICIEATDDGFRRSTTIHVLHEVDGMIRERWSTSALQLGADRATLERLLDSARFQDA